MNGKDEKFWDTLDEAKSVCVEEQGIECIFFLNYGPETMTVIQI